MSLAYATVIEADLPGIEASLTAGQWCPQLYFPHINVGQRSDVAAVVDPLQRGADRQTIGSSLNHVLN
jgi:hypothetical protein